MPSYLVESYASEVTVAEALARARRTAELVTGVRYVRTTFLPEDQAILHLFEAPSVGALGEAGRLAELPFYRIVEAVEGVARTADAL
jgi:hypothetical protein